MGKPILCLDFDGVCHSYTSGWKGADVISDPPVEGLFAFLEHASLHFQVVIYSSRSHQDGGIKAMIGWFLAWCPKLEKWRDVSVSLDKIVWWTCNVTLGFPLKKPAAFLTVDDRAYAFCGLWPDPELLLTFKPWNKK